MEQGRAREIERDKGVESAKVNKMYAFLGRIIGKGLIELGFYIYGRFWSLSANGHQKNGIYNIFYERLENTKKILNISSLKMHQYLVFMSVYNKTGYIN